VIYHAFVRHAFSAFLVFLREYLLNSFIYKYVLSLPLFCNRDIAEASRRPLLRVHHIYVCNRGRVSDVRFSQVVCDCIDEQVFAKKDVLSKSVDPYFLKYLLEKTLSKQFSMHSRALSRIQNSTKKCFRCLLPQQRGGPVVILVRFFVSKDETAVFCQMNNIRRIIFLIQACGNSNGILRYVVVCV